MENYIEIKLPAISKNESLARNAIALFCVELNPTVDELDDVKTAVSEAVTNCIVHAYGQEQGEIILRANVCEQALHIEIEDFGVGIEDVESAMKPFFTTKPEDERSGMGFTIMGAFMDNLLVKRNESGGTVVIMDKKF